MTDKEYIIFLKNKIKKLETKYNNLKKDYDDICEIYIEERRNRINDEINSIKYQENVKKLTLER